MSDTPKLQIIKAPAEILRTVCRPITEFNQSLRELADGMFAALRACTDPKGIGLAANQVGYDICLIVTAVPGFEPLAMCNPEIEWAKGEESGFEMCLSEPGIKVKIVRATKIRVRYQTLQGETRTLTARDLLARCILHELDHLKGILISDHLGAMVEAVAPLPLADGS